MNGYWPIYYCLRSDPYAIVSNTGPRPSVTDAPSLLLKKKRNTLTIEGIYSQERQTNWWKDFVRTAFERDTKEEEKHEIVGKLKAFEERIKLRKGEQVESQENLLFAHGEHSRKGRRFNKREGRSNFSRGNWQSNRNKYDSNEEHSTHKRKSKWNEREWDMSKIQCHKCRKFRHFRKDCKESSTTQEQSNLILEDNEPSLLMTTHETEHKEVLLNEGQIQPGKCTTDASMWYLDDGVSNHMTRINSHFRDIDESVTGHTRFRDGSSKNPLDLVYGDLCGPISPATHSGKKFIFLLVDDCTRFMWAYFLTTKDQAFSTFKEFRQQIKMEMRMKLRMLRTDRGGEFTSNEFTKYCKENGIARQLTAHYSPQQNGVVERRNRTMLSTTRSMIKAMKLPLTFWAEAVKHAIYILNRVPIRALVDKTPYEALCNRNPNLENLRIFGCTTYAKITIPHLKKLDDRSIPMIYLGVEEGLKACRLYDPEGKRKHVSRDVRQAPRAWNMKLDQNLKSLDFKKCNLEQAVYTKRSKTSTLIVGVYVDDLIITGTPRKEIDLFKSQMEDKFEMSDLGLLAYYLGIEVTQTRGEITIKQTGYINKILKETSMTDSNDTKIPMDPGTKLVKAEDGNSVDATHYRSLIGSLAYLLHTRPDLSYSVGLLSRFMQDPKDHHLKAVKQVIRYIKGTKEHGIIYKKEGGCRITGYSDSSYGINTDQGKGTTRIVFYFGESPITWCTQKQAIVALSSCESKFMAATGAACQALWLKRLLSELTGWEEKRITLKVDNISVITLVRNPVFHGRSKNIDIRYHFIRECVENGHINVEHEEFTGPTDTNI
nr:ribonuclease H-like domain, reverse transcriptase, RNA-dependent DNA polymerase [Tanacetum cinerariifolium]